MTPLRTALWHRDREGRPVNGSELIHHSDAGSHGLYKAECVRTTAFHRGPYRTIV